ncbi:hypothetical protein NEFER03_1493 [Nematocida sp. LUAm3]|nr:hypothetical protein NEFER03_1493 [Nematocida sp. LUAm3]KAI5174526.1 hypothetical protein NEFER02_0647 [Nematocida sp. LUAm2]KAI5178068.1 hypothetical protein NEFER01_1250 [Nematocida sp. LUAm1]
MQRPKRQIYVVMLLATAILHIRGVAVPMSSTTKVQKEESQGRSVLAQPHMDVKAEALPNAEVSDRNPENLNERKTNESTPAKKAEEKKQEPPLQQKPQNEKQIGLPPAENLANAQNFIWTIYKEDGKAVPKSSLTSEKDIKLHLAQAIRIEVERDARKKKEVLLLSSLINTKTTRIRSIFLKGEGLLSNRTFKDLSNFQMLQILSIRTSDKEEASLDSLSLFLNKCKNLKKLHLEINKCSLPNERIVSRNQELQHFFFKNQGFAGEIVFLNGNMLQSLTIEGEMIKGMDLFNISEQDPVIVKMKVKKIAYLPSAIAYAPNVYLDLQAIDGGYFPGLKSETVIKNAVVHAGANLLINRIIGEEVIQNKKTLYCCNQLKVLSWKELRKHIKETHAEKPIFLKVTDGDRTMSISIPASHSPYTYLLTAEEMKTLADFMNRIAISNIEIKLGEFYFNIKKDGGKEFPKNLEEWKPIISLLSVIEIENNEVKQNIPTCFSKLYTLTSLIIKNSHFSNLLEIVMSMPTLKHINIDGCTFTHANSRIQVYYINSLHTHRKDSQNYTIMNCSSDEESFIFTLAILIFMCFFIGLILLYMLAIRMKNKIVKETN